VAFCASAASDDSHVALSQHLSSFVVLYRGMQDKVRRVIEGALWGVDGEK